MAFYNLTSSAEFSGATVTFPDGSVQVIASDNKNFEAVKTGLLDGSLSDDELLNLIAPFEAIYKSLTQLSERVSRKGSKLLFDGDVVNNALSAFIIDLMNEGNEEAWKAYIAFMEKLYTNPSKVSQEHLFKYVEANGLQVTPDGDIVAYKGTQESGLSTHQGYGIVNGEEFTFDYLQNAIGNVVEIPRSMVNEDRNEHCSTGLHVGAFEYVTGYWAHSWPRMWVVLVNPRDVVAVPNDFESSKIRVSRYVVVDELGPTKQATKLEGTVWAPAGSTPTDVVPDVVAIPEDEATKIKVVKNVVQKAANGSRVKEYEELIRSGGAGKNLRRFRNKSVTAGRRSEFDEAVQNLGLTY